MSAAIATELRKLLTTRMWWILLLCLAAYVGAIGVLMAFSLSIDTGGSQPVLSPEDTASTVYSLLSPLGYVFPLTIGTLLMTTEFRHRTITTSLLVEPRRSVLLGAKLLVAFPLGLLYGLVGALALVAGGAPTLAIVGDGAYLDGGAVRTLLLGALVMGLWAVLGTAFGAVLTHQVAAIVVILAFTQLVEPVARVALAAFDATASLASALPGGAADAIVGGSSLFGQMGGSAEQWSRPAGIAVFLAYVVVLGLVGRFTTLRRDIG